MDCITLTHKFRICQHNLSLWHTIIRDCQDAILKSIDNLLTPLILISPLMLPQNGSSRFQCTIFTLPCPAIGVILKTGNPTYVFPQHNIWSSPSGPGCYVCLCLLFPLSMTCWVVLFDHFSISHNSCTDLALVVVFMSALWVPKYRLTGSWDFQP